MACSGCCPIKGRRPVESERERSAIEASTNSFFLGVTLDGWEQVHPAISVPYLDSLTFKPPCLNEQCGVNLDNKKRQRSDVRVVSD